MITTTLPFANKIEGVLEDLIADAQRSLDSAGPDKEERAFWRRQRNAFVNALADWLEQRYPLPTVTGYLIPSATRPGAFHRAWKRGGVWYCSCEAGEVGIFHRHTALICAMEHAEEHAETVTYADALEAMNELMGV